MKFKGTKSMSNIFIKMNLYIVSFQVSPFMIYLPLWFPDPPQLSVTISDPFLLMCWVLFC